MWQYVQNIIESKLNEEMNTLYEKLNRKLDLLTKQMGNTKTHKGVLYLQTRFNILLVLNVKVSVF
jgi:hypothetical protein